MITLLLSHEDTDRFPTAEITDKDGVSLTTLTLAHIADGLYGFSYTPLAYGEYSIRYKVYSDVGHTTQDYFYDSVASGSLSVLEPHPDLYSMETVLGFIQKLILNNQKLSVDQKQLIIYDDNGTTPIVTYNLFDRDGVLADFDVFERKQV